jgi:hypothetical protein
MSEALPKIRTYCAGCFGSRIEGVNQKPILPKCIIARPAPEPTKILVVFLSHFDMIYPVRTSSRWDSKPSQALFLPGVNKPAHIQ